MTFIPYIYDIITYLEDLVVTAAHVIFFLPTYAKRGTYKYIPPVMVCMH